MCAVSRTIETGALNQPIDGRCARTGVSKGAISSGNSWGTNIGPPGLELGEPLADGAPGLLGDLELHRSARLFLDHSRSVANSASAGNVIDRQPDEIATPELAVDGQVEHREIPPASFQL